MIRFNMVYQIRFNLNISCTDIKTIWIFFFINCCKTGFQELFCLSVCGILLRKVFLTSKSHSTLEFLSRYFLISTLLHFLRWYHKNKSHKYIYLSDLARTNFFPGIKQLIFYKIFFPSKITIFYKNGPKSSFFLPKNKNKCFKTAISMIWEIF